MKKREAVGPHDKKFQELLINKKLAKIYEHACETGEFLWETEDKER